MSDTRPGADERRMQALLKQRGVGPDAIPPMPKQRPRDWLDDILDTPTVAPKPERPAAPAAPQPTTVRKTKLKTPKGSGRARHAPLTLGNPRQSLLDAYDRIPARIKWLAYHASAAYLGWSIGLVDWTTYVTNWIADTGFVGPQAVFWYATAGGTVLLHHRTRRWWWPVAWLAAVPASSVIAGVLLYAPNT